MRAPAVMMTIFGPIAPSALGVLFAAPVLPSVFSDGMVLQREAPGSTTSQQRDES